MSSLSDVLKPFHKLPFHTWTENNTPIHALRDKTHKIVWHQQLIHLAPHTIREADKHVDGVPDLSKFCFDDLSK